MYCPSTFRSSSFGGLFRIPQVLIICILQTPSILDSRVSFGSSGPIYRPFVLDGALAGLQCSDLLQGQNSLGIRDRLMYFTPGTLPEIVLILLWAVLSKQENAPLALLVNSSWRGFISSDQRLWHGMPGNMPSCNIVWRPRKYELL